MADFNELEHHENTGLEAADIGVVVAYFVCVIIVGVIVSMSLMTGTLI